MDQMLKPWYKNLVGNQNSVVEEHQSLLTSKLEFFHPEIVEYASIYEYCDKLQNSKCVKTMSQPLNTLSQIQYKGVNKNIQSDFEGIHKPHFMITVEEISLVKSVENWTNTNIRVCGRIKEDCELETYYLESVDEGDGLFKVSLDLECLSEVPPLNITLQIFAQLYIVSNEPVLRVIFYRNFTNVNLSLFRAVEEKMKRFVPLFIKRHNYNKNISENDASSSLTSIFNMSNTLDDCNIGSNKHILENDSSNSTTSICIMNDTLDDYNFGNMLGDL